MAKIGRFNLSEINFDRLSSSFFGYERVRYRIGLHGASLSFQM